MFGFGKDKEIAQLRSDLESTQAQLKQVQNATDFGSYESLSEAMSVATSKAGVVVNNDTAMRVSAVYACVRLIAGAIGSMPLSIYRRTDDQQREKDAAHSLNRVLRIEPNPMLTSIVYWEAVTSHILLSGNSHSLISRTRNGDPMALTPIKPSRVRVEEKAGRLLYMVVFDDGKYAAYDQDDILHIPGVGWDGKQGMSAIAYAGQNAVGTALAADEYSARFFANDATPRGYIRYEKAMKKDQADLIRDYWYRKHQGIDNSHLPAIITEGGEFKETTMNAQDSQLIESRRFQVSDIARIFGVPPHMIGETEKSTSWGTGIEQQSIGFIRYTLRPHLTRIEQEVNRKLLRDPSRFVEFQTNDLMRGDIKGRNESYQIALGGNQQPGWMTINEVRKAENLPPVQGGDELYKPLTGETTDEE